MADEIERNPNDAVILNYSQNPVEYKQVPKVWLTHPDSTEEEPVLVPFTYGEAVSKEVVPDFSDGDMPVEIPEGELVTELTIVKPEELVPENIPEGMYIAGVGPGTFAGGGGGGGNAKIAGGVFRRTENGPLTIEHGLGVVPDIIVVWGGYSLYYNVYQSAFGISKSLADGVGITSKYMAAYGQDTSGEYMYKLYSTPIEDSTTGIINSVTEESFTIGTNLVSIMGTYSMNWLAIGGLT